MADGWLEDDRYGTFSSIVERTSAPLQKGDMLLTTLSIKRDDAYSDKNTEHGTTTEAEDLIIELTMHLFQIDQ